MAFPGANGLTKEKIENSHAHHFLFFGIYIGCIMLIICPHRAGMGKRTSGRTA
jgi:hypothetical protein